MKITATKDRDGIYVYWNIDFL